MILRFIFLGLVAATLAGCQTTGPGSVLGGECRIFERPQYAVRGARQPDQDWIDGNVEAGIGGCGWKRPAPRPASFDAKPGQRPKAAPKKHTFAQRFKDRVTAPFQTVPPVVAAPPVIVTPTPVPSAPPPNPRDAVDELLNPSEPIRKVR